MATFLGLVGATLGGWAGAWLASGLGPIGVHLVATVASGFGFYYGRKLAANLLA
jgi:hypothetical protein